MDKMKISKTYKIHTLYNENIFQAFTKVCCVCVCVCVHKYQYSL